MNYAQIVEICCRDLRRYLKYALKNTRGGVVSVKLKRLLRAELSPSDRARYSSCLSRVLHQWRWGDAYVIPREDVEKILETFDELCQSAKNASRRRESRPRRPREEAVLIAVSLPNDLVHALDAYAQYMNMSRSAVVRHAVQQLLDMRKALEEFDKARSGELMRMALRIPTSLLNALNEYAATFKATRSAVIRYAISRLIEKTKTEATP